MDRCLDNLPWAILLLPLAGFVCLSLFGDWIKRDKEDDGAGIMACVIVLIAFAFAVVQAFCVSRLGAGIEGFRAELLSRYRLSTATPYFPYQPSLGGPIVFWGRAWGAIDDWISVGGLHVPFSLLLDPLSCVMTLVVTGVGSLIHIYSLGYMAKDGERVRYFSYLNLFTFFMLLLVLGGSLPLMFVGWEGVGLCSYLLIGFWFKKKSASDAGKKAFIVNRIGDVGIILGMILCFRHFGHMNLFDLVRGATSYPIEPLGHFGTLTCICLLLFVGACGKSAQIPLHVWLPDAMEGPTPVSALIHAATMVTAGVYMVSRLGPLFLRSETALLVVAVVGTATAFVAATIALVQTDIKKVLAYSTVSQLGYMFLACGVGAFDVAIFHLFTHAFFKALLFLGSGSVIHALSGEQDMRKMGGLKDRIPWTFWTFGIGTLAISGIPLLSGFFSKDKILEAAFESGHGVLFTVALLTALLTAFYMFRLLFLTFYGEFRGTSEVEHHIHESPFSMIVPLALLALGSIVAGYVPIPGIVETSLRMSRHEASPGLGLPALAVLVVLVGIGAAYRLYLGSPELLPRLVAPFGPVRRVLEAKWGFDLAFDWFAEKIVVQGSRAFLWKVFDASIIDGLVNGVATFFAQIARILRPIQTGLVRTYALTILFGAVALLAFVLWAPS
jgi:NADH-quinone oxidoreductase subunit L